MTFFIYALYVISLPFLIVALYFLFKAKSKDERLLGTAIFGNSFSLAFWVGTVLAVVFQVGLLPIPLLICVAIPSVIFLLIFFWCIIYLFNSPKSCRYPY